MDVHVCTVHCTNTHTLAHTHPHTVTHSHPHTLTPSHPHRHQQLLFRPSLEEVRAKYYRELKKFVCIPLHFRGVGEEGGGASHETIFPRLVSRNAAGLSTVYCKVRRRGGGGGERGGEGESTVCLDTNTVTCV